MAARLKIGDIVEIKTGKGLAYAHYTHKHKQYGALLRVFRKFYGVRPSDFTELVKKQTHVHVLLSARRGGKSGHCLDCR